MREAENLDSHTELRIALWQSPVASRESELLLPAMNEGICDPIWGMTMRKTSTERLTARQRDCLRLVSSNHSTKEIARALSLSPNTVDGYISEAKEILGAATRRDAARIFQENDRDIAPQKLRGEVSRVETSDLLPSLSPGDPKNGLRNAAGFFDGSAAVTASVSNPSVANRSDSFHWFRGNREHNSLSPQQRLIWIATASAVSAIIFLVALNIIDTLARLLSH
jgi:DNA-binding CsgD family transcriptional regulator